MGSLTDEEVKKKGMWRYKSVLSADELKEKKFSNAEYLIHNGFFLRSPKNFDYLLPYTAKRNITCRLILHTLIRLWEEGQTPFKTMVYEHIIKHKESYLKLIATKAKSDQRTKDKDVVREKIMKVASKIYQSDLVKAFYRLDGVFYITTIKQGEQHYTHYLKPTAQGKELQRLHLERRYLF